MAALAGQAEDLLCGHAAPDPRSNGAAKTVPAGGVAANLADSSTLRGARLASGAHAPCPLPLVLVSRRRGRRRRAGRSGRSWPR